MAKVSQDGLNLIKVSEGLRLSAYLDTVGVPTIGFGTTFYPNGKKVAIGDKITEAQALEYLGDYIDDHVIPYINKLVKVPLTQNQVDALASFIYNLGATAFSGSTLLKKINAKASIGSIGESWLQWNNERKNGKLVPSAGLTARREREFKLYKQ